jgi:hypothetical protein
MEGILPISWLADFDFGSASDFAGVGMKFNQRIGEMFAYCSLPQRAVTDFNSIVIACPLLLSYGLRNTSTLSPPHTYELFFLASIHVSAQVEGTVADDVTIGAYCVVGPGVFLSRGGSPARARCRER